MKRSHSVDAEPGEIGPIEVGQSITPDWLTRVLRAAGLDVVVSEVSATPIGTGQMSSCHRLTVRYASGEGPSSLVAKRALDSEERRLEVARINQTEVGFYRHLAPKLTIDVPQCWFAGLARDGVEFTLLLEDVAPCRQGDQNAGCSVEQARAAVVNLAGLHAPSWSDPDLRSRNELTFLGGRDPDDHGAELQRVVQHLTPGSIERYGIPRRDAEVLEAFAANAGRLVSARREPWALVHGDYRLDNLLFATNEGGRSCVAVDWQLTAVALPARDVGFFVSTALEPEERAGSERELVGEYHGALISAGVDDYEFDRCWDDYRFGLFQATMVTVTGAMFAPRTTRGDQMFQTMARRSCAAIRELDAISLLEMV
jgi:hypothetical protein